MADLILFCLACYGSAALISTSVYGTVLNRKPFSCALCMGFWSATFFLLANHYNLTIIGYKNLLLLYAGAGASYILNRYVTGGS